MAITSIVNTSLKRNVAKALTAGAAVEATLGALITVNGDDQKLLIRIQNSDATTTHNAIIVKGNALQGVADYEIELAPSADKVVVVESGKFVNVSGINKGKIVIKDKDTASELILVSAVELP